MAKTENISIKGLIQKQQLDNLNKSAEEQVQVLKNIESHIQGMDMSTSRLETTEEKSLKLAQETARQEKKDREDAIKQAKVDSANRIKEAIANTSAMTQIALNTKTYRGPIEKIGDKLRSFGDKFSSVSNTLNTLGIVKKGTGGIVSNILEKREDKKEFIKAQQILGNKSSKSEIAKDFNESQKLAKLIAKNEALIKKQRGTVEESDFFNTREGYRLENKRTKLSSQFSSLDLRNKSKNNKEYEPSIEPIEMSAPIGTPTVVPTTSAIPAPIGTPTVVPTESSENKNERLLHETKVEETLEKIEVNTRPVIVPETPKEADKSSGLGGLLGGLGLGSMLSGLKNMIGGLFEGIGNALLGAFKLLFSPTNILKGLAKGFALGTLIASIGKGIYDGFIEWQKTGDIGKAIVEGLGGMIEFLTFGLISKDKYKEYAEWFNGKVDEYIIQPITTFINDISKLFDEWIATPIKDAFKGIGDFFSETMDSFMSMIRGIGIPEFTIPVPEWMGGPIKMGPYYPFKGEEIPETTKADKADKASQTAAGPVIGANDVKVEQTPTKTGATYIPYKEPTKPGEPTKVESVKGTNNVKEEPTSTKTGATYIPYKEPTKVESVKVEEPKIVTPTKTKLEGSGSDYILAEQSIATANLNKETASDNGWMNPQVETTPRPSIQEQLNNLDAQQVYQKSAENVDKKEDMATKGGGNTVVSAPTVNTSNKTVNQQSIKLPTRNPDSTSSRYVSSRYAVQ